ncbi:MAG TPA: cation:proton antiporter [Solirubrobacteraceae bacterium]|nr:cation:proton antiporter [Solirubrobacteraceae bacterium]
MHAPITSISPETFLAIMAALALAGTMATFASRAGITVPVVVAELLAGIVLGPHVLGLQVSSSVLFFKNLGLGLLFFYAGYELDLRRIAGRPLRLGLLGWVISLVLAYTAVAALQLAGIAVSILYCGSAVATTAIGTLIPVLSDSGQLDTPLGTYLLAAGAVGEFGPILLLTLGLSTQSSVHSALILLVFAAATVVVGMAAIRARRPALKWFERTLESSSQLAVRWVLVLLFGLALLAYRLGLDLLLGGFVAGVIVRELLRGTEMPGFDSKLTAITFGLFVPFFFTVSGMTLDVSSFASAGGILLTGVFCLLMLLVRGTPALILYRRELDASRRRALALLSSAQLPLVLAITALATASGRMSPSIAADLVGAALLSTLIFPVLGLRLAGKRSWKSEAGGIREVAAEGGLTVWRANGRPIVQWTRLRASRSDGVGTRG